MTDEQPAPKKRHGTENRQRQKITPVRWEMTEFNKVAAKADRAGLTFGAFMRALALDGDAGVRSQRIPPIDKTLLHQFQGQLGRLNNNVNQIARGINEDEFYDLPSFAWCSRTTLHFATRFSLPWARNRAPRCRTGTT